MDMIFTRTRKKMILHEETRVSVFSYLERKNIVRLLTQKC